MIENELLKADIEEYLKQHENKELLRFITCGSVDDGKSTLIGRLLHDSKMIFEDQLAAIKNDSKRFNTTDEEIDLALLVDGLQSEREQGITIDVAYRYFATDKRKFIIADTPGHEQYTRNMATGASTADLAIILIDARYGVQTQTRRHSFIASLLGLSNVIVAINKMDLMDFSEEVFEDIKQQYMKLAESLELKNIQFAPISALKGDNVVTPSEKSPWYHGETLIEMLENTPIADSYNYQDFRLPVQYVNRPNLDFRGFAGTVAAGIVRVGDELTVLPSGQSSKVKEIVTFDGNLSEAHAAMSVTITLEDEIDISRGDVLVHSNNQAEVASDLEVNLIWMAEQAMTPNKQYDFKFASKTTPGAFSNIDYTLDVNTMAHGEAVHLKLNEIARCQLSLNHQIAFDNYNKVKGTGSFIVIDRLTNVTVGAGMIVKKGAVPARASGGNISEFEIEFNALVRKHFPHWEAKDISELFK
ncbi:sulfate adenylyltransferase subunit CysN [Psychrosphaera aquimarina]|uniref:Sulfate adenylyltransferase subunit 1 n=1 Tax=Psychrosphaera aquimarina TaxID=2044854 RepID=A0ABU3R4H0_9GAMM|nr:sulfate adenylyltransferase subunit CysN [Psychrosphaera aquimarina]MDU0114580.1 sulfate adenylyltransferase subunit CysN [Psychrosphaera aquimarina]